ncbi:MAG: TetR/AcrR family transcriptional regulator [Hyphomicrobiales bacterium]|nr:TetR/AcrR family transcriptional regulator [Hyphomicrobiales bacterium]
MGRRTLNREDWISAAIDLLSEKGIDAVTIDALARRLGITRGSFYHHFKNRSDLRTAILEFWIKAWTVDVRETVKSLGLDPQTTLLALSNTIRNRGAARYDAVIRAWAMTDPLAADYARRADETRLAYIANLFRSAGFTGAEVENRARLLLYYEAFEPMMFARASPDKETELIKLRHELLAGK